MRVREVPISRLSILFCLAVALTLATMCISAGRAFASWQTVYMEGTESGNGYAFDADDIVVTDGRGDGSARVYALRYYYVSDGIFSEFSFADDSWSETYAYDDAGLPSSSTTNRISFGHGRNDGVTRSYIPGSWFTFHEFTYVSPSWQRKLGSLHNPGSTSYASIYAGVVGDGRDDGTERLYTYGGALIEATWNPAAPEQDWFHNGDTAYVDSSIEVECCLVDDARGDGNLRVYAADYGGLIYEYEWDGLDWTRTSVGTVAAGIGDLAVGVGRNDGIRRLYAAGQDNAVYEFSWTGSWELTSTFEPQYASDGIRRLAIGPGRNDGIQRVYWASSGTVGELTWAGTVWTEDRSLNSGLAHNCGAIAVGAGRNDGVFRVYTGDSDGYIAEHTFESDAPDLEVTENIVPLDVISGPTQDETVKVYNAGTGSFDWTVSGDEESWLTVSPMSGETSTEYDTLTITADPGGLTDGQSYNGSFTVSRNGAPGDYETVSVSFTYDRPDGPDLEVNANTLDRGTIDGQDTSIALYVYNAGTDFFDWTVSGDEESWLTVEPMSGTTSTERDWLTITVDTSGLVDGQSYSGSFTVSRDGAPGDSEEVTVSFTYGHPNLELTANEIDLDIIYGLTQDTSISVYNKGTGFCDWAVTGDEEPWLTVSPMSGSASTEQDMLTVIVDPSGLSYGYRRDSFRVHRVLADWDDETVDVSFYYHSSDPPDLEVTTNTVDLGVISGLRSISWVCVQNDGGLSFDWTVSGDEESWLAVSPRSGTTTVLSSCLDITVDPDGLTDGQIHSGSFTVSRDGAPGDYEVVGISFTYQEPVPPVASFSGSPTSGDAPLMVNFTDQSTSSPTSWSWSFGDGGTSTEQNSSHTYTSGGSYTVSLTATNAGGSDTETKVGYITVSFRDVLNDHWAHDEILACVAAGVVFGFNDGRYLPAWEVDRGQMAVFIARALAGGDENVPTADAYPDPSFDDVAADYWAYRYIQYAVGAEVIGGYGDGTYRPEEPVDRGQMAAYMARAKGWVGIDDGMATAPELFPDVPAGFWAGTAVQACVENDVVRGYDDGYYRPDDLVTRDQMAVYIARAFELTL